MDTTDDLGDVSFELIQAPYKINHDEYGECFKFEGKVVSMGNCDALVVYFVLIEKEKAKELSDLPGAMQTRVMQEHGITVFPEADNAIAEKEGYIFEAIKPTSEIPNKHYSALAVGAPPHMMMGPNGESLV